MRYRTFRSLSYLIIIVPFAAIAYRFTQQIGLHEGLCSAWLRQAAFFLPITALLLLYFAWDIYKHRRMKKQLKEKLAAKRSRES